jgi:CelD/BcsL family acetyltransferase involved in cellulose biosynthesis
VTDGTTDRPQPWTTPAAEIRILASGAELDAFQPAWDALAAACPLPTALPQWGLAAASAFADRRQLAVVAVQDRGRGLLALAPLVSAQDRRGWYVPLGGPEMAESTDLLHVDRHAADVLARALAAAGLSLDLDQVPANSPTIPALRAAYGRGAVVRPLRATAPTLALDKRWTAPEGALSGRRAQDLRRARRRAETYGTVTVDLHRPVRSAVTELLAQAMAVEDAGWKGRGGTSLLRDAPRRRFMRELVERASLAGRAQVALLSIGGEAAAMQIALEHANSLWLLKIGYDERFARCSPGSLLLLECIRDAAARGLRSVELMGAHEPWTDMWTRTDGRLCRVSAYPCPAGRALGIAAELARLARRGVAMRRDD